MTEKGELFSPKGFLGRRLEGLSKGKLASRGRKPSEEEVMKATLEQKVILDPSGKRPFEGNLEGSSLGGPFSTWSLSIRKR